MIDCRELYLDLMIKVILNLIYEDPCDLGWEHEANGKFHYSSRVEGRDWPSVAHSMIGYHRMKNIQTLSETIFRENIQGDFIEAGAWRGGACIFMQAILKSYNQTHRNVWVADSFEGLPKPNVNQYPEDEGNDLSVHHQLAVSLEQVKDNFKKYGLLNHNIKFLKGWFKDTLPKANIEKISMLRLDGDYYESTMDSLNNLYHKVVPGGFIIIDDYYAPGQGCPKAVRDFLKENNITITENIIDGHGIYWRK
jgi:O-methyltransferase